MISDRLPIEPADDKDYKFFQKINKYGSILGLTALTAAGLADLVLKHTGIPQSSELVHKIVDYGISPTNIIVGLACTIYFGPQYVGNNFLNKRAKKFSEQKDDYSLKE